MAELMGFVQHLGEMYSTTTYARARESAKQLLDLWNALPEKTPVAMTTLAVLDGLSANTQFIGEEALLPLATILWEIGEIEGKPLVSRLLSVVLRKWCTNPGFTCVVMNCRVTVPQYKFQKTLNPKKPGKWFLFDTVCTDHHKDVEQSIDENGLLCKV
jgi:hypothetical protein